MKQYLFLAGLPFLTPFLLLDQAAAQSATRPVQTVIVQPFAEQPVMFSGIIESQTSTDYSFQILGRMLERPVNIGDEVEAGDLLATLEATVQEQNVRAAEASLLGAQAALSNATAIANRQRSLLAANAVAEATVEESDRALRAAQSAVRQAEAALDQANEGLEYTMLRARFPGTVISVGAEAGQVVSAGQPVVTIAQPAHKDAVVDLPERFTTGVDIGTQLQVHLDIAPDAVVAGTVREIGPLADPVTRTRRVKVALEEAPASFRLGSIVRVLLPGGDAESLKLPKAAVLTRDEQTFVWVLPEGSDQLELRKVSVSAAVDGSWSVENGLQAGERVVSAGVNSISEGQSVRIFGAGH